MRRPLYLFFPFLLWMRGYTRSMLRKDAAAGLTVALVLVPQSMANAQLAGLPAYHGLYAAFLPALVGGLWGSSRQMVTGSVAVTSLMAAAALQPLAGLGPEGYIASMALLTLCVGVVQLLCGAARMGILVNFLSLPVIAGFTNASALIIASSQLAKLAGIRVEAGQRQYQTFVRVLESAWEYVHLPSLCMALLAGAIIWGVSRYAPKLPAILLAVVCTTFLSWLFDFEKRAVISADQIASGEIRGLLRRLDAEQDELTALRRAVLGLEARPAATPAERLELEYRIRERRLAADKLERRMALTRDHLRHTLFAAHRQPDGSLRLYVKKPSDLLEKKGEEEDRALSGPGPARRADREPVPADAFLAGGTWRLVLGSGAPDPNALTVSAGGAVVGAMPSGLPRFVMPRLELADILRLLPQALIIAFIGFAESVSIAKAAANRLGYRIDANQELTGQGLANIAGGLMLTSPVSGSFSNSAVNIGAGAKTGLASAFAGCGALAVLLFLTGPLAYLPQPVLAVIILRAVGGLIHMGEFCRIWTAQWQDGCIALITFLTTLWFAPHLDYGIAAGVVLSLAAFFYRSMRPTISSLSCGPDNVLHDVRAFSLRECRHIAIIHFQGPLFFANAALLEDAVLNRLETQPDLRHIHLVCTGITHMDASGEDALAMLVERAAQVRVDVSFSGVVGPVAEVLDRTGVLQMVGPANIFVTPREAVCAIHERIEHDPRCDECPLRELFCRPHERKGSSPPLPDASAAAGTCACRVED